MERKKVVGMQKMPTGVDNFRVLREKNYYFVDKTYFIKEILDNQVPVTLITRPRRFGKTLTLSMLKEFFDINAAGSRLFEGLSIAKAGEAYTGHQGKYPVIFISLKDVSRGNYGAALHSICDKISDLYFEYNFLAESAALAAREKRYYASICDMAQDEKYDLAKWGKSLRVLTLYLWKHYGIKPILLIDEYDAPIQSAWEDGYYDEMIQFMRQLYSEVLKTNEALEFAVLTGVLRVAKESIFSGLNNLRVCSVLSAAYRDALGFTGAEVAKMAQDLGREDKLPEIREWYDGYNFGGQEIYNPWSVIQYFQEGCTPAPYWVNTSANGIIRQMVHGLSRKTESELQQLMQGESVCKTVHENIIYNEIGQNSDDFYTMLLITGYLKAVDSRSNSFGETVALRIPNKEILNLFRIEILRSMAGYRSISDISDMLNSMLAGEAERFEMNLELILRNYVSYHDAANGESFYHGMMLGFCVLLQDTHIVKSNRESGYGRFDLALIPKDNRQYGVILEFKRADNEAQLEAKAMEALKQIEELAYGSEFEQRQINKVWKYGIAFCGKKVCLRTADV